MWRTLLTVYMKWIGKTVTYDQAMISLFSYKFFVSVWIRNGGYKFI